MKTLALAVLIIIAALAAHAREDEARDVEVKFKPGADSAHIEDSITGYETVNYRIGARAGQIMVVDMKTDNGGNQFNIFSPGKGPGDQAMYIGMEAGGRFEGVLPEDGVYTLQTYLMRSAARRNEKANYTIDIKIDDAE